MVRNFAINSFQKHCDYVAVLDANNYITESQFNVIKNAMNENREYILVPIKELIIMHKLKMKKN